ncbi:Uncharacterised protein [Burkholderia pseudomallei]|nr:Uncharacterised protein [Burkholderia pseudomallei]
MLGCEPRDDPPDVRRTREVHAPHARIGDQALDERGRVGGRVREHVDDAVAEPRVVQRRADQRMHAGAQLGRLQHDGIAARERHRERARAEDHGRVPRGDAEHDAARRAHREREIAGHVGRHHVARDPRRHRCRLAQHVRRERDVQADPRGRRARFRDARRDERRTARVHQVGRLQQAPAALGRRERGPHGKRRVRGGHRALGVGGARGRRARRERARHRIAPLERRAVFGLAPGAADQHPSVDHRCLLVSSMCCELQSSRAARRASLPRRAPPAACRRRMPLHRAVASSRCGPAHPGRALNACTPASPA